MILDCWSRVGKTFFQMWMGKNINISETIYTPPVLLFRDYFLSLGGYDPGLLVWGGENFELSFKVSCLLYVFRDHSFKQYIS